MLSFAPLFARGTRSARADPPPTHESTTMNVQRWMSRTVITCQPQDSLQRAAQLLWDYDLGALPVIDATHKLVGIITDRDLCMAAFTRGSPLATHTVESAMARTVYTLQPK